MGHRDHISNNRDQDVEASRVSLNDLTQGSHTRIFGKHCATNIEI